jgi:DME family drug/metabolite transporter
LAGLLAWGLRGEVPGWGWAVATLLAVGGCTLLGLGGGGVTLDLVGLLLAVGAGGSYALYVLASKELVAWQRPEAAMGVVFGLGALLLLPLVWREDFGWLGTRAGFGVALHLGLVTVAVAYALFAQALRSTRIATAVTLTLAEPLTATLLGVVVLGEALDGAAWAGVGLLFAGLVWLALETRWQQTRHRHTQALS